MQQVNGICIVLLLKMEEFSQLTTLSKEHLTVLI